MELYLLRTNSSHLTGRGKKQPFAVSHSAEDGLNGVEKWGVDISTVRIDLDSYIASLSSVSNLQHLVEECCKNATLDNHISLNFYSSANEWSFSNCTKISFYSWRGMPVGSSSPSSQNNLPYFFTKSPKPGPTIEFSTEVHAQVQKARKLLRKVGWLAHILRTM